MTVDFFVYLCFCFSVCLFQCLNRHQLKGKLIDFSPLICLNTHCGYLHLQVCVPFVRLIYNIYNTGDVRRHIMAVLAVKQEPWSNGLCCRLPLAAMLRFDFGGPGFDSTSRLSKKIAS